MQRQALRRNSKLQAVFDVVKLRLEDETHQLDSEALHARSLLEESQLLKLLLVDPKRLVARKMELHQIGIMKAYKKFDKEAEGKHFEKQCKAKF